MKVVIAGEPDSSAACSAARSMPRGTTSFSAAAPAPLPGASRPGMQRRSVPGRASSTSRGWLRTETELVLKSRPVAPGRLLETGFRFDFPGGRSLAEDLCSLWRRGQRGGEPGTLG